MAAVTQNSTPITDYWGATAVEIVDITIATSGDTFTSQFASVAAAFFEPTTAASHGATISGNVVTFVTGGALTGKLKVVSSHE